MQASRRIVVIGGTGLIGSKTIARLRAAGHEAIAASPGTGVNTITGEGLAEALAGADVVVDVSNAPSWEASAVRAFFETSSRNLLAAEAAAGVGHHVALSIVGTDRMPDNGYFLAKVAQEKLITEGSIPYTIVRSTQFFEFLGGIADSSVVGDKVRLSGGLFQPIAADDVAQILADIAVAAPVNGIVDIAGPERAPFDETVRRYLALIGDARPVERDPDALYFGGRVSEQSLVPLADARLGATDLAGWLQQAGRAS
ncbi:SDR family oxidoreductase [Paracidovorax citrulli]